MTTWRDTPTKTITIDGTSFAYRELGNTSGVRWSSCTTSPPSWTTGTHGSSTASRSGTT